RRSLGRWRKQRTVRRRLSHRQRHPFPHGALTIRPRLVPEGLRARARSGRSTRPQRGPDGPPRALRTGHATTDPPGGGKPHMSMSTGTDLIALIASRQNRADYQKKHWHGTFAEYLEVVRREPRVTRTAYQRLYDLILGFGTEEISVNKDKVTRYRFF